MPLFSIELHSGREIRAVACYQIDTYEGGLAIGSHSKDRVERIVARQTKLVQLIDPVPTTILLPIGLGSDQKSWCLPMYSILTWFISEPAHAEQMDGSHMAVIVYQNELVPPYSQENESMIRKLEWEATAEDFNY